MKKSEFILDKIQELIYELWEIKGQQFETAGEKNCFEEDMKQLWDDVEEALEAMVEIGEVNESLAEMEDDICKLEDECDRLKDRNSELAEENESLWDKLKEISKVVNDTWS